MKLTAAQIVPCTTSLQLLSGQMMPHNNSTGQGRMPTSPNSRRQPTAESTQATYPSQQEQYGRFYEELGIQQGERLTPDTLAMYIMARAIRGYKLASVRGAVTAVSAGSRFRQTRLDGPPARQTLPQGGRETEVRSSAATAIKFIEPAHQASRGGTGHFEKKIETGPLIC